MKLASYVAIHTVSVQKYVKILTVFYILMRSCLSFVLHDQHRNDSKIALTLA